MLFRFFNLGFGGKGLKGGFLSIAAAQNTDIHNFLFPYPLSLSSIGKVNIALRIVASLTNQTPDNTKVTLKGLKVFPYEWESILFQQSFDFISPPPKKYQILRNPMF